MDEDARELDLTFPIPSRDGFMQAIEFLIMAKQIAKKRVCICISICACMYITDNTKHKYCCLFLNIKYCKNR